MGQHVEGERLGWGDDLWAQEPAANLKTEFTQWQNPRGREN